MKKILVPTDFSLASFNALEYSLQLAAMMDVHHIDLIHVYSPEVEGDYPTIVPPIAEYMNIREQQLEEFVKKTRIPATMTINRELLVGFAVDELRKKSPDYEAIVMSTTGEGGFMEKIFGSVSSAVAQKSHCPVFLIPPTARFEGYEHILYASNYESADDDMIEAIVDFNKKAQACIHFVHVRDQVPAGEDFSKSRDEIFEELFDDGDPGFSFEFDEVKGESVAKGLNAYAQNHPVDLVVMVNKQRSFWERMFHKSRVREMVFAAQKPMMIMHLND